MMTELLFVIVLVIINKNKNKCQQDTLKVACAISAKRSAYNSSRMHQHNTITMDMDSNTLDLPTAVATTAAMAAMAAATAAMAAASEPRMMSILSERWNILPVFMATVPGRIVLTSYLDD